MIVVVKHQDKATNKDLYVENYGYHFNKKLCEFALSEMHHPDKPDNLTWEQVMSILDKYKIKLDTSYPYDIYYVANMAYHDYYKHSIKDDEHLALFIQDYLEDEDGYEGVPFCRWLTDMQHKSVKINWGEMI